MLAHAPLRLLARQVDGRPDGLLAVGGQVLRRSARGVAFRQHVGARHRLGRQAQRERARMGVREGGRVQDRPLRAQDAADQGEGRERQPLPLKARPLRRRLRGRGRAHRDRRAHRGAVERRAQRHHGRAAGAAVHAGEGEPEAGREHGPARVHGRLGERADSARDDARAGGGPRMVRPEGLHRQEGQGDHDAGRADRGHRGRKARRRPRLVAARRQGELYRGALHGGHLGQARVRRHRHKGGGRDRPQAARLAGRGRSG